MLGELPKLFGKAFAIGFFLPAAAFMLAVLGLSAEFGYSAAVIPSLHQTDTLGAAVSIFVIWMGGVTLMALNRPIIRFFEGYGEFKNPLRLFIGTKRQKFDQIIKKRDELEREFIMANLAHARFPSDKANLYRRMLLRLAREYPDRRDLVLPTDFGNRLRAFEVYSRVVYGLEGIDGWTRLIAVIPTDYRQAIEDSKAKMDFWVNLWAGGWVLVALYCAFGSLQGVMRDLWIPFLAAGVAYLTGRGALMATGEYGVLVMSAFDLFRGDLCKKLGLEMPSTIEEEREMWTALSQTMVYRSGDAAQRLSRFRQRGSVS
jgi:hypothetical protein